jgi:hypothetical protein
VAKIIVPVGYPTGAHYPAKGETEALEYSLVLSRDVMITPTPDYYQAWRLLFSDPEAHRELRFTMDHAVKLAEDAGLENAAAIYDALQQNGLLASFEVDDKSSITFLKNHRLVPQGVGLGNTEDDPTMFHIQLGPDVVISLMYDVYTLWMGADTWPTMWENFREYAKNRGRLPIGNDQLSYIFAAAIPGIVAAGAGFVTRPL